MAEISDIKNRLSNIEIIKALPDTDALSFLRKHKPAKKFFHMIDDIF